MHSEVTEAPLGEHLAELFTHSSSYICELNFLKGTLWELRVARHTQEIQLCKF